MYTVVEAVYIFLTKTGPFDAFTCRIPSELTVRNHLCQGHKYKLLRTQQGYPSITYNTLFFLGRQSLHELNLMQIMMMVVPSTGQHMKSKCVHSFYTFPYVASDNQPNKMASCNWL